MELTKAEVEVIEEVFSDFFEYALGNKRLREL